MLHIDGSAQLHKLIVLNPKGGSGKTTLAFNLAGYLASTGRNVALIDMDRQGSSTHWLSNRPAGLPRIHGISVASARQLPGQDQYIQIPGHIEYAVIDAPVALAADELSDYTCGAHAILVPVLPSDLDIHAAARLISQLLLAAQVSRRNRRLGVVANRVNERTIAYKQLMRFLKRLSIAVVGVLRESQNYVHAAREGRCIHEMPPSRVSRDLAQWEAITQWVERCLETPLTSRDLLRPAATRPPAEPRLRRSPTLVPIAAALAVVAVSILFWSGTRAPTKPSPATVTAPVVAAAPTEVVVSDSGADAASTETAAGESAADLSQRWLLSGVAQADGSSIVILKDRDNQTTRRVTEDESVDGWFVTAAGPDFAILAQHGEEVRLEFDAKHVRQESESSDSL